MKRILLDSSPLESGHKGRGVGTYTRELKQALEKIKSEFKFEFNSKLERPYPDLIHYPYFDLFFQTLPFIKKTKTIVTVHDVIPLKFQNHFPVGVKGKIRFLLQKKSLKSVNHIITDSAASKEDICKYLEINEKSISIVQLAAGEDFTPQNQTRINKVIKKYQLPKHFVLYVGDINYNKNLPFLIKTIGEYDKLPLVIVTRTKLKSVGELQTDMAVEAIQNELKQIKSKVFILEVDSQKDLNCLYSGAMCYIQPSLAEGFGLPILEAYQSGTIVVSSNRSSLPEVGGETAIYFDPTKSETLTKALNKVLFMNHETRLELINKNKAFVQKFSWQKTAQKTLDIYKKVLQN